MKNLKFCVLIGLILFFLSCRSAPNNDQTTVIPKSTIIGRYVTDHKALLRPTFITGVNSYLRRYSPRLITESENYVKMTAKYNYDLDIELIVHEGEYEIVVTVAQDRYNIDRAQSSCVHVANGVHRTLTNNLAREIRNIGD